ncbi:MAG TPA: HD domain-containing protein [Pyrinomonadaceae bacterium]|nr:HD domain-containing protein [Pyrinomonadaceae bacterium]
MNNLNNLLHAASYSAQKHTGQTRKDERGEPYINHPLEVANLIANIGGVNDIDVLMAAILHDTVEDCGVTRDEIALLFGETVAGYVMEVTDDKSLEKAERKRLQIEHAPHLSSGAKIVKLADKISNITDITNSPPADWSIERRREYVDWGSAVVAGLRGVNEALENHFDSLVARARTKLE